ncbi:hypothetical protein LLG39_08880 [bacterium]|nr:hypothetical protein [bacterium]
MALDELGFTEGVGANVATHVVTEDAKTKHIERIAPGAGQLGDWDNSVTGVTAVGLVSGLSVSAIGRGRIIVGAKCETSLDYSYSFFLVFKNASAVVVGVSATVFATFKQVSDGGSPDKRYASIQCFANDCGATTVELYLVSLPAGATSIDLYMAAL